MNTRGNTKLMVARTITAIMVAFLVGLSLAGPPAHASLFYTVNETGDEADANPGDGLCDVQPSAPLVRCTLRAAIQESNANPTSPENIIFNIPGDGVKTISPNSALPRITDPVTINGYTQPGSSPNTLAKGTNAKLMVQLNGTNAGELADGLEVDAPNSVIKGLVINRFDSAGVDLLQQSDGSRVEGNFIGTGPSGKVAKGNSSFGVKIFFGANNDTVGGTAPAARNLISGNEEVGVKIFSSSGNEVFGNLIGTQKDGSSALGNGEQGVDIFDASNNFIGDGTPSREPTR